LFIIEGKDLVLHLAAQVAVTTSIINPREDFEINALGTFNVLEAIRKSKSKPILIYASTNKIYGEMTDLEILEKDSKYQYDDLKKGISEVQQLDFHSPYGCSEGCADQYVRDYARIFGLKTIVFRLSCIYGHRQFGVEDQGWLAHFIISAVLDRSITIYGNGKQVRDVLYIDDLIELFHLAYENADKIKGMIFNIGGGAENQISLLELISILENKLQKKIKVNHADWRLGDQRIYVSDITKARNLLRWKPKVSKEEGINKMIEWVTENKELLI